MLDLNLKDKVRVEVIDINYDGLGIGRYNDKVVFIERGITGETVDVTIDYVNKNYYRGHVVEVVKRSNDRVDNACGSYPWCGGCSLLHMKYEATLKYKLKAVKDTLQRIGHIDYNITKIYGMEDPYGYRNKVQIPVGFSKGKLICGYYQSQSHKIVPFEKCLLQSENVNDVVNFLKNIFNEYKITNYNEETKKGCLRHILIRENYLGQLMIVFITNEKKIESINGIISKILNRYKNVISIIQNINSEDTNVILGNKSKVLYGEDEIIDKIGDISYRISHKSFFQINRNQTLKLYNIVLDYTKGFKNIIDAYSGVGSISLMLSKQCQKVYGIEVVEEAVNDARNNALLNKINNAEFTLGKVEDEINNFIDKKIDCIVIDPPRKGLDVKVIEAINNSKIKNVVYVSCNPATLARDLNLLSEKYEIKDISLVDMFGFTSGIESVVKLTAK